VPRKWEVTTLSSEEVVSELMAAKAKMEYAARQVAGAARSADESRSLVANALRGGGSGRLAAMLTQLRENLVRASEGIDPTVDVLNRTIERARALGKLKRVVAGLANHLDRHTSPRGTFPTRTIHRPVPNS
jgi:hypothetical protein